MTVLRTTRDGCFSLTSNYYGTYIAPVADPLADTIITKEQMEGFELSDDIARIPSELWSRWIQLCIEMVKRNNADLEVSCRLLRSEADPSVYRILVPVQQVTTVSVRVDSFDSAVDIETGETVTQYPPEGWRPVGSSHSHNTMNAFFSGTDDKYELGDPGLHIVVGEFDVKTLSYELVASVTANFRRFLIDPDKVVDVTPHDSATYHPNVLDAIKLSGAVLPVRTATKSMSHYGLDDWEYDYNPVFRSTSSFLSTDSDQVKPELIYVMDAVDDVVKACQNKGLSVADVLQQLAFDIEDRAESARPDTDPFYWSV